MLVHQAKRLNSANVVITNHDATVLPAMHLNENGLFILYFHKSFILLLFNSLCLESKY